jgi:hypothetical protein
MHERAADCREGFVDDRDDAVVLVDHGRRVGARLGHIDRGDGDRGWDGHLHGVHEQHVYDAGVGAAEPGDGDGLGWDGAELGHHDVPERRLLLLAGELLG